MEQLAELRSNKGTVTLVGYDFSCSLEELVRQRSLDCCIVSTEDGFSPLGASKKFFSSELGISEDDIAKLANWNRFTNQEISLIGLPSLKPESTLKGVILAASETSKCYEQFAPAFHSRPYRDFYYNVAYESIAYAANVLGAKNLAISHLSGSGHFHEDIATCVMEALAHFCDMPDSPNIGSFLFTGCCIDSSQLSGIRLLNLEAKAASHRDIRRNTALRNGYEVVSIDWK
jgi:hypothetical protein